MCLYLVAEIAPDAPAKVSARRLSEVSGLRVRKLKSPEGEVLHFSTDGGCSCGFLEGGFEINAAVWKLQDEHLPALVKAIELLGRECQYFRLSGTWLGEEFQVMEVNVKLEKLLEEIKEAGIRNSVNYTVTP